MGVDTRGNIKNALRRSHGRYFDDLADSQGAYPAFSGLSAVTLTADTTLAVATHSVQVGAYVNIATDANTLTLPAAVGAAADYALTTTDGSGNTQWTATSTFGITTGKAIAMAIVFG